VSEQNANRKIVMMPVDELKLHPANASIYGTGGDAAGTDLVDSIREHGIRQPLLVTPEGVVISGERRLRAARRAGLEEVPCTVLDTDDPDEILIALIECNRQRVKTPLQKAREIKALLDAEKRLAAARRQSGLHRGKNPKNRGQSPSGGIPPDGGRGGRARDRAGAACGVSGETAAQMVEIVETIDALREVGRDGAAKFVEIKLNKSINAAHKEVTRLKGSTPSDEGGDDRADSDEHKTPLGRLATALDRLTERVNCAAEKYDLGAKTDADAEYLGKTIKIAITDLKAAAEKFLGE
jgi:ParB-like chromosome segregation protein Spo0J